MTSKATRVRVLVVDDSPEVRTSLRRSLRDDCEIVAELSDGYAAAAEVEETQPDVVIMDMQMPVVDGAQATRQIKALFPHVVVIGYTSDPSSAGELNAAGPDASFLKPDSRALRDHLRSLV